MKDGFPSAVSYPLYRCTGNVAWENTTISRTGGQHGTGETGKMMAPVSGFVLHDAHTTLYIAGDIIWCEEVNNAMDTFQPDYVVVNAGEEQSHCPTYRCHQSLRP